MTTYSTDWCGGDNVWIEIHKGAEICTTKKKGEFFPGDILEWTQIHLGSCQNFVAGVSAEKILFKIKTDYSDQFCPAFLAIYTEKHKFRNLKETFLD